MEDKKKGVQNGYPSSVCGAPVSDQTSNDCLQELDQLNKEIETVSHEVEKEQRRLSRYHTTHSDSRNTASDFSVSKSETADTHVDGGSYGLSSCTEFIKTGSQARKYVVDNSKPRTDLEYDPLSNFSAGLRQKGKNGQGLKRERDVPCDQKKPVTQTQLSQSPLPEPLDDSNEDGILIIDVPPLPDKKRSRTQKLDCIADKFQGTVEKLKELKTAPVLRNSPQKCKVTSPCASSEKVDKVYYHCGVQNNQYLSTVYGNDGCEIIPVDESVVDLTGCSEDLVRKCQKITYQAAETDVETSLASHLASSDQQDQSWNSQRLEEEEKTFQVEPTQSELSWSVEINPLQPHNFLSKNSLFCNVAAVNSPNRQHTKQAESRDQPAQNVVANYWSPKQRIPSLVPGSQKMSSTIPGQMQGTAIITQTSSARYQGQVEPASGSYQFQTLHPSSTLARSHLTNRAESSPLSSEPTEQLLFKAGNEEIIIIISSSDEEELNYSDVELSDSDPMEECYRIFMEANNEHKGNEEQPGVFVGAMDVEKPEFNITPQALPAKKRMAREVKHTQVQQRASATCQRKPETQTTACLPTHTPANTQPAPVQNAYMNHLSLGNVIDDDLHLILPEGTVPLPVTSSSCLFTSVLTPVTQVYTSAVSVKQVYYSDADALVPRYRTTAPVRIPAPTRKPSPTSALAPSSPAASATPQPAVNAAAVAAARPPPTKRKLKQQCEAAKVKVPHDVRQRYVNMFTEEYLKITANANDAFEKAVAEERTLYNRSMNKLKYQSAAVNALKRLKNQSAVSAKDENEDSSQRSKGNIPLNLKKVKGEADDMTLYESLRDYILSEESLIENNYPVQHPEKPGSAALFADNKKGNTDSRKRICCRCGATYSVSQTGKHIRKEECNYHYGRGVKHRVPGGVETRYSCCEGVMGAPGCQVFKLHVHGSLSLDGFVSTIPRYPSDMSCPGVYSLDCEMCYTVHGLELSRVTVVNSSLQVVYDTFVRPDNEVIDYNTRFSGIREEDVKGNNTSLREVQETLLSFISADTILIGHGLETDLCALKLLHGMVVDTSVVFPHRLGPPHKLTLNSLTAEYLRRIIQESVCGHDTAEDAVACMELMLWKVKEDGKLKK
ncbi:RNA exonuclease 1 homolog isoform X3 [Toxotes jaculatrix]|uniref:RNA exonuclease 1 homolog isoform X3 n=1 Tax=Toxotes jaculatrix TaxID=941984 RepID=UPI001B3A8677|nr:RNA exonuclease 1 homolog isoform X3 [Toxotes jaculatrix]